MPRITKKGLMGILGKAKIVFNPKDTIAELKELLPKDDTKPETKTKKSTLIGKKTNDGDKVIIVNNKVIKRVNQRDVKMVELVTDSGRKTVLKESEVKDFLK